jgi:hypothetical protein
MSQTIRQQIAQKQAELAELERQANLLEKVEVFKTFRDLDKANPSFQKITILRNSIVEKTLSYRQHNPDFVDGDMFEVLKTHPKEIFEDCMQQGVCPFSPELITEPFDLIIATETDPVAIEILEKSKAKVLEGYTNFVERQNAPLSKQPWKEIVPDVSKKGKKSK